ncbi:MAG: hypothetical protein ACKVOJ_07710 [Sphingomonadaceae bacterium]
MAMSGLGFFDVKGQYFKSPEDATLSDLAALLGRVGEGDSLAPGIAKILLLKRRDVEKIFADHDAMMHVQAATEHVAQQAAVRQSAGRSQPSLAQVTPIAAARSS